MLQAVVDVGSRCAGLDAGAWFRGDDEPAADWRPRRDSAIRVCTGCPVRAECEELALRNGDGEPDADELVRAGLTGPELAAVREHQAERLAPPPTSTATPRAAASTTSWPSSTTRPPRTPTTRPVPPAPSPPARPPRTPRSRPWPRRSARSAPPARRASDGRRRHDHHDPPPLPSGEQRLPDLPAHLRGLPLHWIHRPAPPARTAARCRRRPPRAYGGPSGPPHAPGDGPRPGPPAGPAHGGPASVLHPDLLQGGGGCGRRLRALRLVEVPLRRGSPGTDAVDEGGGRVSSCGHPPRLVTVNAIGADGKPYQAVRHEPCQCGGKR
ncbi:hypothetical protein BV881_31860 [Streptomyces sp. ZL-24]|nr:hypothetical protein BV881_31860 [Streptomyces sp. ZL-24]